MSYALLVLLILYYVSCILGIVKIPLSSSKKFLLLFCLGITNILSKSSDIIGYIDNCLLLCRKEGFLLTTSLYYKPVNRETFSCLIGLLKRVSIISYQHSFLLRLSEFDRLFAKDDLLPFKNGSYFITKENISYYITAIRVPDNTYCLSPFIILSPITLCK
jgi:hypothetical protein